MSLGIIANMREAMYGKLSTVSAVFQQRGKKRSPWILRMKSGMIINIKKTM